MLPIQIYPAAEDDRSEIISKMVENFIELDPFANYFQFTAAEFYDYIASYLHVSMQNNLAFVLRNQQNKELAAINMACDFFAEKEKIATHGSVRIKNWIDFFAMLNQPLQAYFQSKQVEAKKGISMSAGFMMVDKKYYGLGLPALMSRHITERAKEMGFRYIIAEFTNPMNFYLHKRELGERLKVVHVLRCQDFVNRLGERPLQDAQGEVTLTVVDLSAT